ncbi:pantetheine-phosphate adenylyltransferase [Ottowia sp. GY511]|uniref:Phosphopantetheine adenylyltransferase n=1 Tax=Ottowia flava TaxID=2675430 RepID=A0ABW4KPK7_9BURK|nr:pantetheine-phosphate adenylyltransferase [Ottowia sp. GY511]TXK21593.1 pantetheine-phosphate adenylyltransferase [Ottowia sp. GY511]
MSRHVIAVYPGTFDPITRGHEDIIRRARELFDEVIIAVAIAHHKKTLFSFDERLAMVQESAKQWPGVRAEPFDGLISHFVQEKGGKAMVRGLRAVTDFDYEFQLAGMNANLAPEVESVFLTPSGRYQFVSSTFVREIALLGGDVQQFVSPHVWQRLMAKKSAGTKP